MTDISTPVLRVTDLNVHYAVRQGLQNRTLKAVDGVSLALRPGECLGLVGESGCGKSSLAQAIIGIVTPTSGRVEIAGVTADPGQRIGGLARARAIQMVFQDPYSSLNPRMTIRQTLSAPLHLHKLCPASEVERRIRALLGRVGLEPNAADRYPHAFSGGQRQRLCIARALAVEPRILVCDEPVSALDVSIRAQIINLLLRLKDELGLALLMISHDLGVVEHMSDRIAVMYLGRFVEEGRWDQVLSKPAHPYTRALLASVPGMHKTGAARARMTGEAPSALRPPPGCAFHPRCPVAVDACRSGAGPGITGTAEGHQARCHLLQQGVTA